MMVMIDDKGENYFRYIEFIVRTDTLIWAVLSKLRFIGRTI